MKNKILLVGGGGHCTSCIDVIEQNAQFEIGGIIDKGVKNKSLLNYPILGGDDLLPKLKSEYRFAIITIGQIESPLIRMELFKKLLSFGYELPSIISPRAYVSKHSFIGLGSIVMHDAVINSNASIGNNCIINTKALIEHDAVIEDNCHISTGAVINGSSLIKQGTFFGSNAVSIEFASTKENDFIKAGEKFKGYKNE